MDEQIINEMMELVEGSRDAVVCSVGENGSPKAKAMFRRKNEGLRVFWFSSNVSAARTQQWLTDPKACVYFMDGGSMAGLMLTGYMQVCTDEDTKRAFWAQCDERYYPLGPTDPDYCMLRFTAESGDYWHSRRYVFNVDDLRV